MADNWDDGSDYDAFVGRWSRKVAPQFLDWLAPAAGGHWIDLGCGTGALSGLVLERAAPASVLGIEPSDAFRATAAARIVDPCARFASGTGAAIPAEAASADFVVSALVLNFLPDLGAALAEMRRVLAPGGTVAGYVWDYAGHAQFIRRFWEAALAVDPAAAAAADEGRRFPLCQPDRLAAAFNGAGLSSVAAAALDITTAWDSFEDYWRPFTSGTGPAPGFCAALPEAGRAALKTALHGMVPQDPDGRVLMAARVWAVRGSA